MQHSCSEQRHPSLLGPSTLPQRSLRPGGPQHLRMPNTGVLLPSRLYRDGASGLGLTRRCPLPQDPPPGLQGLGSACAPHPWVSVPGHLRVTLQTHRPALPQGPPRLSSPGGDQGPPASSSLPWCPQGLQRVPQEHRPAEQPALWSPASSSNRLSPTVSKDPALPGALQSAGCPPAEAGAARATLGPRTAGTERETTPTTGAPGLEEPQPVTHPRPSGPGTASSCREPSQLQSEG